MTQNPLEGKIDRAIVEITNGKRTGLYLEGWLLHRSDQILMLQFGLPGSELILIEPVRRPELAERFNSISYAELSGYKVRIPLHDDQETPGRVFFTALLADGFTLSGCIDIAPELVQTGTRLHVSSDDARDRQVLLKSLQAPWYDISFPASSDPEFTIFVDIRNTANLEDALLCLHAVASLQPANYSVSIICADESQQRYYSDKTKGASVHIEDTHVVRTIAEQSKASYLLFLEGSLEILPGSLQACALMLLSDPQAGILGGLILAADNSVSSAGGYIWYNGEFTFVGSGLSSGDPVLSYARQIDVVRPEFMITNRELFLEHGGFDHDIGDRELKVLDYCLRVGITGIRCWYVPGIRGRYILSRQVNREHNRVTQYHRLYERHQPVFRTKMRLDTTLGDTVDLPSLQKERILLVFQHDDVNSERIEGLCELIDDQLLSSFHVNVLLIGDEPLEALSKACYPRIRCERVSDIQECESYLQDVHASLLFIFSAGILRVMARYKERGILLSSCRVIFAPALKRDSIDQYVQEPRVSETLLENVLPEFVPSNHNVLFDEINGQLFTYRQFVWLLRSCDMLVVPDVSLKREFGGLPIPVHCRDQESPVKFFIQLAVQALALTHDETLWDSYDTDALYRIAKHDEYPVTIVLPYYNAVETTAQCISSLFEHTKSRFELIVIDDGSDDENNERFKEQLMLTSLPDDCSRIVYLRNPENQGFAASVNRGMAYAASDVVLLNSDTMVPENWLQRLLDISERNPHTASITPLSNHADVFSLPISDHLAREDLSIIDSLCDDIASKELFAIPTGVGFCMYLRGSVFQEVGFFDKTLFSPMYAEENDWCLRAAVHGFKHGLMASMFVYHEGEVSLTGRVDHSGNTLLEKSLKRLSFLYPSYEAEISAYHKSNTFQKEKERLLLHYWKLRHEKPFVLVFDVASKEGGSTMVLKQIISKLFEDYTIVYARNDASLWYINDALEDAEFQISLPIQSPKAVSKLFDDLDVQHIFVNNIVGWSVADLCALLAHGKRPYTFFCHDYYAACPSITLLGYDGSYCGAEKDPQVCSKCLSLLYASGTAASRLPIIDWRHAFHTLLSGAERVFTPGEKSKTILESYYPDVAIKVFSYDKPSYCSYSYSEEFIEGFPFTIGIPGAIGDHKGYKLLKRLNSRLRQDHVPCRLVVIGFTPEHADFWKSDDERFVVSGAYKREEISSLLAYFNVAVSLLPSVWPETYLLTADEVYYSGYPAISFGITEAAARIEKRQAGWVVPEVQLEALILLIKELVFNPELVRECSRRIKQNLEGEISLHNSL